MGAVPLPRHDELDPLIKS